MKSDLPMVRPAGRRRPALAALALTALTAVAAVTPGCTGSPAAGHGTSAAGGTAAGGTAAVAYAGSLQFVNEKVVGPAFHKATGDGYQGRGGGSFGLAGEIRSGEITPNVFMSVGSGPVAALEPSRTSWYVTLMATPLVVAYDPHGPHGAEMSAIAAHRLPLADLFDLMAAPGFKLGRTNPATDPQGQAFVEMVHLAQSQLSLPSTTAAAVLGPLENPSQVFAETALEAELQAGQLDAASALLPQALQLHLPYVALPASLDFGDPGMSATYAGARITLPSGTTVHGVPLVVDVTTLRPDVPAADAFVAFLLSPAARADYARAGYTLLPPTLTGAKSTVPPAIARALG